MPGFRFMILFCCIAVFLALAGTGFSSEPNGTDPKVAFAPPVEPELQKPRQLLSIAEGFKPQPLVRQAAFAAAEPKPASAAEKAPELLPAAKKQEPAAEPPIESPKIEPAKDTDVLDQSLNLGKTKSDKTGQKLQRPKFSGKIAPVVSVIGSLLIVLSVFLCLALLFRRMSPQAGRLLPSEAFENLGRTAISPKLQLHLLRLGNRLILVSVSPDGITPVTEITDPDEVVPLLGMCTKNDKNSSTSLFRKAMNELVDKKTLKPARFRFECFKCKSKSPPLRR